MAYVPVPKDLTRVKSKLVFNLTKRQIICFSLGALAGVPLFFLTKGAVARVLELEVYADKALMVRFSADGVIVATPTGSTAYSMSAGGPIVEPTAENMIVTPICPHALSARSVILGRERLVSLKMGRLTRKTAYLSVDGGKAFRLSGGDTVELRVSKSNPRLVRVTGRSFYDILSQKLGGAKA